MKTRTEILHFRTLLTEYSDAVVRHQNALDNETAVKAQNLEGAVTWDAVIEAGVNEIHAWQNMVDAFNRCEEAFCTTGLLMVNNLNDVEFKLRGLRR